MLGIKLTDKSIETLFTRLVSQLSGNASYAHIFNNEVKEVYDLFKIIHDNYLEAFTELRYTTLLKEGGESMVVQSIERMRIDKETERRLLVAKINSLVDDFVPAKKKIAILSTYSFERRKCILLVRSKVKTTAFKAVRFIF